MLNTGNSLGKHRTPLEQREHDLYETPSEAVEALLKHIKLPQRVWEPACGKNCNIVVALRKGGHNVLATDLVDYHWPFDLSANGKVDFLKETNRYNISAIVTNPPFRCAHEFVQHARKLCPLVIMLERLTFLESERRRDILDQGDLREVLIFRNRLPMMHLDGWEGNKNSSALAFAWFVWDRSYQGSTIMKRISWGKKGENDETGISL